jgi:hypothetical protein
MEFFDGVCVQSIANPDAIRAMGQLQHWRPIPKDLESLGRPAAGNAYESWSADYEGRQFIVALSEGIVDGRRMQTCSVLSRGDDPEQIVHVIESHYEVRQRYESLEGYQRTRGFVVDTVNAGALFFNLLNHQNPSIAAVNLSVAKFIE